MAILQRAKSSVFGLVTDLSQLQTNIDNEAGTRSANAGTLASLTGTVKTSLVGAINEAISTTGTLDSDTLKKASNLSDVTDATTSRSNISVYSTDEVDLAINNAKLALGTNYVVATITERDALTDLTVNDNVHVSDDGDGQWAKYLVSAITDGVGSTSTYVKISDQTALENSMSASSIKASYESNANTNEYDDTEQTKVSNLSVTTPIDLDKVIQSDELITDLSGAVSDIQISSALAMKNYADAAATAGGSVPRLEILTVSGSSITLTDFPKNGVNGILNFGTVRYIDGNGVAYDAPVIATADPYVYTISTNVADEWNTYNIQIQYLYTIV
ncbi:MAG: hypothetical protein PF440_04170 [Thiomicrorhabdus sp.]|jgi:hypothetical protein|nr:hypothetical protein [Thiomicrorhabdus sp.]